jgi:hypothetical protein
MANLSPENIRLPKATTKEQYEFNRAVRQNLVDMNDEIKDLRRKVSAIGKNNR